MVILDRPASKTQEHVAFPHDARAQPTSYPSIWGAVHVHLHAHAIGKNYQANITDNRWLIYPVG